MTGWRGWIRAIFDPTARMVEAAKLSGVRRVGGGGCPPYPLYINNYNGGS